MNTASETAAKEHSQNAQALVDAAKAKRGFLSSFKDGKVFVADIPLAGVTGMEATEKGTTFDVVLDRALDFLKSFKSDPRRYPKPTVALCWRDGLGLTYRETTMSYSIVETNERPMEPTAMRFRFSSELIEIHTRVEAPAPRITMPLPDGMTFG